MSIPLGALGTVRVRIPATADPGEVELPVRGGFERFLAYSDGEIPEGASVMVIESIGVRSVRVVPALV